MGTQKRKARCLRLKTYQPSLKILIIVIHTQKSNKITTKISDFGNLSFNYQIFPSRWIFSTGVDLQLHLWDIWNNNIIIGFSWKILDAIIQIQNTEFWVDNCRMLGTIIVSALKCILVVSLVLYWVFLSECHWQA